jgi:hypothetical protein
MRYPLPRPLFPSVVITPADEAEFTELVAEFVDKLLAQEHEFCVTRGGRVDAAKWKHAKQTRTGTVYHGYDSSAASSSSESDHAKRRLVPLLVVSKVPESLDDLAYSFLAPTRDSAIIQASYLDPTIADVEILHSIRRPTLEDPLMQLHIKWIVFAPMPAILTPRDYVYIDALGTCVNPHSGERVCYRFCHSIELKGADALTQYGFIRSKLSISTLLSEDISNGGGVREYARAFFAPGGLAPQSVFIAVVAGQVSSTATEGRTGEFKKLALALRRKEAGKWTGATLPPSHASHKSDCTVCTKTLNMINTSRDDCALCGRRLCTSCRVRQELSFVKADMNPERQRVTFCAGCAQQAINMPSRDVAVEEFLACHDGYYRMPASLRSNRVR